MRDTHNSGPKADPVAKEKKWIGDAPTHCDICKREIHGSFIDGRVHRSSWAFMCNSCHPLVGVGLGLGKGQHYEKQGNEWIKVEG